MVKLFSASEQKSTSCGTKKETIFNILMCKCYISDLRVTHVRTATSRTDGMEDLLEGAADGGREQAAGPHPFMLYADTRT